MNKMTFWFIHLLFVSLVNMSRPHKSDPLSKLTFKLKEVENQTTEHEDTLQHIVSLWRDSQLFSRWTYLPHCIPQTRADLIQDNSTVSLNDVVFGRPECSGAHCHNLSKESAFLALRIFFLRLQWNLSLHNFYLWVLSQNVTNVFGCLGCLS